MIGLRSRLNALLQKPLFGTKVIPPDARVDPSQFSEDDFPVYCPKCEYLLRGLPDGRCPECGQWFDRGRLLVLQYVRDWERQPAICRAKMWAIAAALTLMMAFTGTARIIGIFQGSGYSTTSSIPASPLWVSLLLTAQILLIVLLVLGLGFFYYGSKTARAERDIMRKRRQVIDAYLKSRTNGADST